MIPCFVFLHFWSFLCHSLPNLERVKREKRGGEKTRWDAAHLFPFWFPNPNHQFCTWRLRNIFRNIGKCSLMRSGGWAWLFPWLSLRSPRTEQPHPGFIQQPWAGGRDTLQHFRKGVSHPTHREYLLGLMKDQFSLYMQQAPTDLLFSCYLFVPAPTVLHQIH